MGKIWTWARLAWNVYSNLSQAWQIGLWVWGLVGVATMSYLSHLLQLSWPARVLIGFFTFIALASLAEFVLYWTVLRPKSQPATSRTKYGTDEGPIQFGKPTNSNPIGNRRGRHLMASVSADSTERESGSWAIAIANVGQNPITSIEVVVSEVDLADSIISKQLPLSMKFHGTDSLTVDLVPGGKKEVSLFDWETAIVAKTSRNFLCSRVNVGTILRFPSQKVHMKLRARDAKKVFAEVLLEVSIDHYGYLDVAVATP